MMGLGADGHPIAVAAMVRRLERTGQNRRD
jgi:hypothetical protein